jgi:multidrug efflux pump subunit AcrB
MPDLTTPYMAIQVIAPGVSATELEEQTISDIEKVIVTYSDVTEIHTTIYDNIGILYVLFSYNIDDPDLYASEIFVKLGELELDSSVTEVSYDTGLEDPHIIFAVHSTSLSQTALEEIGTGFKNELLTIDSVARVDIDSPSKERVLITLDPNLLSMYGIGIMDVYQLLQASTLNIPLGGVNTSQGTISVIGNQAFDSIQDLEEWIVLPVTAGFAEPIMLGDLATISIVDQSQLSYTFDQEPALFLSVYFQPDIDFTVLGDEILTVKDTFLSNTDFDVSISEMLFLPDYVNDQINTVFYSLLVAIGVVMLVVLIGIGVRNSLLIVLTVPLIVFGTVGVLFLADQQLHKLTIVGLIVAIGIMVDNSIVITESIKHYIDQGQERVEAGKLAITKNIGPILSSTLTTIAAFIVIVLLPGFLGNIVRSMPLTVIIAISLSFLVSMIFSPIVGVLFLRKSKKEIPLTTIHETRIRTMIRRTIKFPLAWLLLAILSLVGMTYLTFSTQPIDLYPNDDRAILYIDYESDTLFDLASTTELKDEIESILMDQESLLHIASSVGGSLPHFHFSAPRVTSLPHYGRTFATFDMNEEELFAYKDTLEDQLQDINGATISVSLIELSPPEAPLKVTITSDELADLEAVQADIITAISSIDTIQSMQVDQSTKAMNYQVTYDDVAIRNAFLTRAEVDSVLSATLNGFELSGFTEDGQPLPMHLATSYLDITDILAIPVHSDFLDTWVPLSDLIAIDPVESYSVITRYNNQFVLSIDLEPTGRLSALETDIDDVLKTIDTTSVSVTYGGENQLFEDIQDDLVRASIIALILIFIILFIQFNNFIEPMIVLLTIPLSFTGSFLFLWMLDIPITATALIGLISLMGVTVNTGILLVEYIRKSKALLGVKEACVEAVLRRFRPIMLTSFTTILGLIPLYITGGSFFRPLAITFMGGMITSTLITIFLIPSVYTLLYHKKRA